MQYCFLVVPYDHMMLFIGSHVDFDHLRKRKTTELLAVRTTSLLLLFLIRLTYWLAGGVAKKVTLPAE